MMGIFFLLRYGMAAVAFAGWLVYQKWYRQKRWEELRADTIAIAFFILVWMGIAYWMMH